MVMKRIAGTTAVLGLSAILLTGCGLFGPKQETAGIDVPPDAQAQLDQPPAAADKTAKTEQAAGSVERTVYLLDSNGYVVPVSLTLPKTEGAAKQVLSYMVKGGPVEQVLPDGFSAVLPEGTRVLGLTIKDGTAVVDFSPEFQKYDKKQERNVLDAVTRALTEFSNVKSVTIWVNGKPLTEMPAAKTPATGLMRSRPINMELADNAVPGQTTPVTVYFQGQLDDKRTYYVPVTRLVPRTEDAARAAVEELIKGPKEGSPLFSSLLKTTRVLDVKREKDTVVVNLSDDVLKYDSGKEANPEAMEALVLTLADTTGAAKVQVLVDGKPLTAAGSLNFSKPVSRPQQINAMQF